METLKAQALENIRAFVKSTSKKDLIDRLNFHNGTEGGVKVSYLLNDNIETFNFYQLPVGN